MAPDEPGGGGEAPAPEAPGGRGGLTSLLATLERPRVSAALLLACLAAFLLHHGPRLTRFLDPDEQYVAHASWSWLHGEALYSAQRVFYPPVVFLVGAVSFLLAGSGAGELTRALLIARGLCLAASAASLVLVLLACRRLRIAWLMPVVTTFACTLTQMQLKVPELRADCLLDLVVVFQAWLLWRADPMDPAPRRPWLALGLTALLVPFVSQKGAYVELGLLAGLLAAGPLEAVRDACRSRWRVGVLMVASLAACLGTAALHAGRSFVSEAWIEPLRLMPLMPVDAHHAWLLRCIERNPYSWLVFGAIPVVLVARARLRARLALPALGLWAGGLALLLAARLALLQDQLHLVWCSLAAAPVAAALAPGRRTWLPLAAWGLALLTALTAPPPALNVREPLLQASRDAEVAAAVVGGEPAGFAAGSLMTGRHAWRQDAEGGLIYATLHAKQHAFSFREEAIAGQVAFLHDPEGQLRKASLLDERLFFAAHYVPTAVHGLFIAGEWLLLPGGPAPTTLELPGARLAWAFPESAAVTADGLPLRPGQPLRLTRTGAQSLAALTSEGPALVYVERDAGTLQHPAGMGVDPAAQCDLQVLGASYGGKLTLLAVARWRGAEQDTYRVFWRKDTAAPLPVAAFHHLMDASAAYVAGVNVTPGGGWCAAEEMPVGTVFSYAVQLPHAAAGAALHVGLYDRSDWKRRLPCPGGTWTKVTFD